MKSQVTRITAATLLSVGNGASLLANLASIEELQIKQFNGTLNDNESASELAEMDYSCTHAETKV